MEELKEIKIEEKKADTEKPRVIGGISWPEDGNPAFLCMIVEKKQRDDESLDPQVKYLEIVKELEGQTVLTLLSQIDDKDNLSVIYGLKEPKYYSFLKDFIEWKKDNNKKILLKQSLFSSFESGVLRIKDFISTDKLKFFGESKVKEQLKIFSKLSYKNYKDFYAIGALSCAISAVRKREKGGQEQEADLTSWY